MERIFETDLSNAQEQARVGLHGVHKKFTEMVLAPSPVPQAGCVSLLHGRFVVTVRGMPSK